MAASGLNSAVRGLDAAVQCEALPMESLAIIPLLAGPDGVGLAAPYVYWRDINQNGVLLSGATFKIQGLRNSGGNWRRLPPAHRLARNWPLRVQIFWGC